MIAIVDCSLLVIIGLVFKFKCHIMTDIAVQS